MSDSSVVNNGVSDDYKSKFTKHIGIGKRYYHLIEEVLTWCASNLGDKRGDRDFTTMFGNTFFQFTTQEQLTLFMLRWGHITGIR
jgi:hypothetical protein